MNSRSRSKTTLSWRDACIDRESLYTYVGMRHVRSRRSSVLPGSSASRSQWPTYQYATASAAAALPRQQHSSSSNGGEALFIEDYVCYHDTIFTTIATVR